MCPRRNKGFLYIVGIAYLKFFQYFEDFCLNVLHGRVSKLLLLCILELKLEEIFLNGLSEGHLELFKI